MDHELCVERARGPAALLLGVRCALCVVWVLGRRVLCVAHCSADTTTDDQPPTTDELDAARSSQLQWP
jgi:hypothetical protein